MYTLDTDIVIWILRKEQRIIDFVKDIVEKNNTSVSTITVAEIYKNIFPDEILSFDDFLSHQAIIPVTVEIAKEAGLYWQKFHRKLLNLSITDCIVASTTQKSNSTLLTLNTRHFPMSDIKILDPLKKRS